MRSVGDDLRRDTMAQVEWALARRGTPAPSCEPRAGTQRPASPTRTRYRAVERAERLPEGPRVVAVRDLVLPKLYAGGTQDLWDAQAQLALPGAASLIVQVDEDLATLPADMRERWARVRP